MLKTAIDSFLSVIYPQECRICRNSVENFEDGVVCSICWDDAKFFSTTDTLCSKCGAFLSDRPTNSETFCKQCADHAYDVASAVGVYRGPIAASVIHLKTRPEISKKLSTAFAALSEKIDVSDRTLIIPVPLSKLRMSERGFNQALVLAEIASRALDCRIDSASLSRITHTAMHRAAMDRKARDKTVKNAFKVERPKLIEGRDVILVDDVLTSGATASHCADELKKSGAVSVRVLTLARAV